MELALERASLARDALDRLATIAALAETPAFKEAARRLNVTAMPVTEAALAAAAPHVRTQSARSIAAHGVGSVAEAAALAAAGSCASLILERIASPAATCALARLEIRAMTVHFIGAGPGAADLITVRGRSLVERCPVCLYAGSIVPPEMLSWCPPGARLVDTAPLDLDAITAEYVRAHERGEDVARLHSGDLSIWSAMGEQLRRLDALGIPYTITPGVPAFAAAAAALGRELTVPEVAQSLVLTRTSGRASAMPETERLATFAADAGDPCHSSVDPCHRAGRRGLAALLRRRLSGRRGLARVLAGRAGASRGRSARLPPWCAPRSWSARR